MAARRPRPMGRVVDRARRVGGFIPETTRARIHIRFDCAAIDDSHRRFPEDEVRLGSNSFGGGGQPKTDDGRAILANDPHLQYSAPGIWYPRGAVLARTSTWRVSRYRGFPGFRSVPPTRSRGAWTNTTGDFEDMVLIDVDPAKPRPVPRAGRMGGLRRPNGGTSKSAAPRPSSVRSRWSRWGTGPHRHRLDRFAREPASCLRSTWCRESQSDGSPGSEGRRVGARCRRTVVRAFPETSSSPITPAGSAGR